MNKISPRLWLLLTALFALALTTFTLSHIVTAPWHEIPELGADGGKNLYTYLYQVLYGKGIWFQGMNYPYGEHIVYTDGQPLLSVPLSYLPHRISIGAALTIMWWMVALSYVLSIIYCFKILLSFKVQPLVAICFAGLISIFTPQVFRISGHYALSVTCIIPMLFYWTLQYYNSSRLKYVLYIFIMGCLAAFLHPYYAAVLLVWAGFYTAGYFVMKKEPAVPALKHTLPLLISVMGVFAIFGIFMKLTDPATDRPTMPYGILANCTGIKDVIASVHSPVWKFVNDHSSFRKITDGGEGRAYIGLAMLITVAVSLFSGLRNRIIKKKRSAIIGGHGFQPIWLFIAFAALLLGMGAPFAWHMEWMLDYAPLLRQFRTLGRFSWIFYYIITIYGAVVAYQWYAQCLAANRRFLGNALLLGIIGLWAFEASGYIARTHQKLDIGYRAYDTFVSTGQVNWEQFLQQHQYHKEDFQATIVLPFFEVGSEKLWVGNDENISAWAIAMGIQAGIQLHLPMMDGMMSRTSWDVAFKQVKMVGGPYADKPALRDIKNDKPFLLIALNRAALGPDEKYLFGSSDFIGEYQDCKIYACHPEKLRANYKQAIADIKSDEGKIFLWKDHISNGSAIFQNYFDQKWVELNALTENGGIPYSDTQNAVIGNFGISPAKDSELYEFSCWFRVSANNYKSPVVDVEVLDSNKHILFSGKSFAKESTDNYKLWLRTNLFFYMPGKAKFVRCTIENIKERSFEAMAELVITPAAENLNDHLGDSSRMIRNHLVFLK